LREWPSGRTGYDEITEGPSLSLGMTGSRSMSPFQAYSPPPASKKRMPPLAARKHSIASMTAVPPANDAPDRDSDARLVERARTGDVGAFEHVYRREVGRVYALCLRMTADAVKARELTQSVFVRAWDRLGSFRGDSQLSTWLHRIAVNEVLTEARTDRRRRARVVLADDGTDDDEGQDESGARSGAPDRAGITLPEDVETRMDLERAIAALPRGARTVFVLHDIQGYRHEEISRMTGSAEGTLRAQLHRARRLLMEALSR
jgi:RNA polymerase sigma-70 factor, ECF subfamily